MKTKILILPLVIIFNCRISAQRIDTLWKNNPEISDSAKLELLGETCYNLVFEDTAKSKLICEEMLKLAPGADNIYARINAYRTAGIIYQELEDNIKIIENYTKAVTLASALKDNPGRILYGKTLSNFGLFYHINGDYQAALKIYLMADSLLDPFDLYNFKINICSKISDVYDHLHQLNQCGFYYNKILKLAGKAGDTLSLVTSKITMALFEMNQKKFNEAEIHLKEGLVLAKYMQNPESLHTCYFDLGETERLRGNLPKALEYFKESEKVARHWGDAYSVCLTLEKLGSVFYKSGNLGLSRKATDECIVLSRQNDYKDILRQALGIAVHIEDTLGNYKKALDLNKEYNLLLVEATDLEVRKSISFLDAKYQAAKREAQISNLESQQKLQDIKLSRNRLWLVFLLVLLGLLLAATILVMINFRYKRKLALQEIDLNHQKIQQLEKEKQLIATQAVLSGEESERRRLARDLHDGLGGMLSGIKLKLSNMKGNFVLDSETRTNFENAIESLDASVKEMRRVAHNLMPEVLVKYGISEALGDFCSSINVADYCKIGYRFYGEAIRIDQNYEVAIYRIAQELLNNALKHAQASKILVQFVQETNRISLTVQDNGKGFDIKNIDINKGVGIGSIKSRVAALNGSIDINSALGKGTEIEVEFIL
jgi:two-component system NarL family sensor kinase